MKQKRFVICPGYVVSENDGQVHWISFSALTRLYGLSPAECIRYGENLRRTVPVRTYENFIFLGPQRHASQYDRMREELARGEDAFKLIEP